MVERNDEAIGAPDTVNTSPYERAWLIRVRIADPSQTEALMAPREYDVFADADSAH